MQIKLHANATTTPKQRAYIQSSSASVAELAQELGVTERTIRRWKDRSSCQDYSHRPHNIRSSLNPVEEEIAVELRTRLHLSLDDILEVMHRGLRDNISRSALYRCLKRRGVSGHSKKEKAEKKSFEETAFGYVHVDLKHLTRLEKKRSYIFVAIERITNFAHVEVIFDRKAQTVADCFGRFLKAFGYPVHTVLSDNGSEFTDRFGSARYEKRQKGTGRHPFDLVCKAHKITHKLTQPYHPQTNGKVERFNRRISEALASTKLNGKNYGKNNFLNHKERNDFIYRFVDGYNRTRLRCLGYKAPLEVLSNQTEHYTFAGMTA